ncbi:hypothetical protein FACS1894130_06950 [Spirochaetia bacterium]|nr:hypothetical protein FACS1894130_06950 [Spirochaetia bacterium]
MIPSRIRQIALFLLLPLSLAAEETGRLETLISALDQANIPYEERVLNQEHEGGASSIWVRIGATPLEDDEKAPFVLAIPLGASGPPSDGTAPADGGLPFGVNTALAFARQTLERGADRDMIVAFLGDEVTSSLEDLYEALNPPEDSILLYLDLPAAPGGILIHHGSRGNVAPLAMVKPLTSLLADRNIPYAFDNRFNELYKLGLAEGPGVLESSSKAEIPSILISAGGDSGPPINPESFAALLSDLERTIKMETGNADTHYSIYHYGGKTLFISERLSVVLLLLVNALVLLGLLIRFLTRRLRMIFQVKTGFTYFWVSLLYFLALFLAFLAGEMLFLFLARLFKVSDALGLSAEGLLLQTDFMVVYWGMGLGALTGIALFFCLSGPLLTRINVPRRAGFYGFTALICSIVGFLGSILLDITIAPLFAWTLICTVLGMAWQRWLPAFIWAFLSIIRPLETIAGALKSRSLAELSLAHGKTAALIGTVLFLPLLMLLMRGFVLAIPYGIRKRPLFFWIKLSILILCLGLLVVYTARLGSS